MTVTVRSARSGDGAAMSRAWLSAGAYYAEFDPEHFQVPASEDLGERWDRDLDRDPDSGDDRSLMLVAESDGVVAGWLTARLEPPSEHAAVQLTREHSWTVLMIDALVVDRSHWRGGVGTALLEAAEAWGRARHAQVVRLDTYAHSPVSVPFYEERMGYERRAIIFQKHL
jgi:GNAT superfamily N-acetyltransferase